MAKRPELAFQDDQALLGSQQNALLDAIKRSGGSSVRANVIWGKVRQGAAYDEAALQSYDKLVNAARARGLGVQMTLMGTPSYNPNDEQELSHRNANPQLMKAFARDMAQRYKGRVGRYSIWNEPNYDAFIAGAGKDPKAAGRKYRELYRSGYAGVKAGDKAAQVLLGEITSQPNAKAFLSSVLAGKPLKTAGLAYHPYEGHGGWDVNSLGDLQATLGRYKRQGRLQTSGGKAAPLYLTEFGYQRDGQDDAQRAQKVARAYDLAAKAGARQLLQYQVTEKPRPTVTDPDQHDGYGNLATKGGTRPAGWVWDTSIAPSALANALNDNRVRAARAARARQARKR